MQQHSVPQNITGFEFKLIGALTIKQFGYLVTAAIAGFVFYLIIPGIFKWFFVTPIVLAGLALAFMPVNGIGFDKWVVLFIQAISSPSLRIWRKEPKELSFLSDAFSYYLRRPTPSSSVVAPNRTRLKSYLAQFANKNPADKLDQIEQQHLTSLFNTSPEEAAVPQASPTIPQAGSLEKLEESIEKVGTKRLTPEEIKDKVTSAGILPKEDK